MANYERFWHKENHFDKKVHVRPIRIQQAALLLQSRILSQQRPNVNAKIKQLVGVLQVQIINPHPPTRECER